MDKMQIDAIFKKEFAKAKEKSILMGFSTGCFYKTSLSLIERVGIVVYAGCQAIELNFLEPEELDSKEVKEINWKVLTPFSYVSLHAPAKNIEYGRNNKTREIFEKIRRLNDIRPFDWVVIHPDKVSDFAVFCECGFNVAIENMDCRKQTHKTPVDIVPVLNTNPNFGFILDVQHVFSNDPTMRLARRFYETVGSRVCEIHLSGYRGRHFPIFKTRQTEIIQAIQNFEVPMIIESVLRPEDVRKETDYIEKVVKKIKNCPA